MVRSVTTLSRLLDVLPALHGDERLSIKFTIDWGSNFAQGLAHYLAGLGMNVLPWRRAARRTFDLIIAAHANPHLGELNGPLVVLPHGAGYARILPTATGTHEAPVGLAPSQLTVADRMIPAMIGLSHPGQFEQLSLCCPTAVGRGVVIGDPTFDRLRCNVRRRAKFRAALDIGERTLVCVTSTWGQHSALASHHALVHRLVAQLPLDQYAVLLILHPNIWFGHSRWEVEYKFRDLLDSGLLIIPPERGWQSALIAADVVVGDHGSVGFYGAALGRPFLLSASGLAELDPRSPRVLLSMTAPLLDIDGDLRAQVESVARQHDTTLTTMITTLTLAAIGQSLSLLRAAFYELLRLTPPIAQARVLPLPAPEPVRGTEPTSFLMTARILEHGQHCGGVVLERFPWFAQEHGHVGPPVDRFAVVLDAEVDEDARTNAEILVASGTATDGDARQWLNRTLAEYPGAGMAVAATTTGCLLSRRSGRLLSVRSIGTESRTPDPLVAAAALHGWLPHGGPVADKLLLRACLSGVESVLLFAPVGDAGQDTAVA